MAAPRVAVVGAGLAGLSAMLALKERGFAVDLYDRSRLVGGRATSFEVAGHEVDNGQHVFLACCTAFIDFVERVGMGAHLHVQERFDVVALGRDGSRSRLRAANLPAPFHLLASFLHYHHLSWAARLQVGYALARMRSALRRTESFDAWLRAHGQSIEAIRAFWEPFVVPALNAPLDRVSASDAAFVIVTAFLKDANAARFGFSTVPLAHIMRAAAEHADRTELSCAVLSVEPGEQGVWLVVAGDRRVRYDAAVLAVPPDRLARMLPDAQRLGLPPLDGYEATPIVDIHLWHDAGTLDFAFATLLDSPVQWIFQKESGYLCCSVSAAKTVMSLPTDELALFAWREVCNALAPLRKATLQAHAVTRNPYSTYLAKAGVERPGQRTTHPALAIAGSWTQTGWPDTMESAVRSGRAAAQALAMPTAEPVAEVPLIG